MTVYLLHVCRSSGRPMEDVRFSEWSTGGRELLTKVLGAKLRSSVTDKLSLSGPIRHILTSAHSASPAQYHVVGWGYRLFFFCRQNFSFM